MSRGTTLGKYGRRTLGSHTVPMVALIKDRIRTFIQLSRCTEIALSVLSGDIGGAIGKMNSVKNNYIEKRQYDNWVRMKVAYCKSLLTW